jgi:hypothetical protein
VLQTDPFKSYPSNIGPAHCSCHGRILHVCDHASLFSSTHWLLDKGCLSI